VSKDYRNRVALREERAGLIGWFLPPIAIQRSLHQLARTDINAQLAYQDRVRAFHARLRHYYYPYLFVPKPFTPEDYDKAPQFSDDLANPMTAPR
jgi:ABC-2 type transport system permease protein